MNKIAKWTMAVAMTAGSCSVMADTTYNVNITDGTESITGTIVTDGKFGLLAAGDIGSFDLTWSGPVPSIDDGTGATCYLSCQLTAVGNALVFTPNGGQAQAFEQLNGGGGNPGLPLISGGRLVRFDGNGTIEALIDNDACVPTPGSDCGYAGTSRRAVGVIGTVVKAPEIAPSSAIGALTLLLGSLMVLRGWPQRKPITQMA